MRVKKDYEGYYFCDSKTIKSDVFAYADASIFKIEELYFSTNGLELICKIKSISGKIPDEFKHLCSTIELGSLYVISCSKLASIKPTEYKSILDIPHIKILETKGENND